MWKLHLATSRGGYPVRSIVGYALAVFLAAFLWILATPQSSFASTAEWNGSGIQYEGNLYTETTQPDVIKAIGLLPDTTVYDYLEPGGPPSTQYFIYFIPGADPSKETKANYVTWTYNGQLIPYTDKSTIEVIELSLPTTTQVTSPGSSACNVDNGLGWVVCPLTDMLAGFMDWSYDVLSGFLEVRSPDTANRDNPLYRVWGYMRTFANIAFVIAFLLIIYSQLTSIGISNYSLKKLVPRLIIAALLVNLSYIICALAIDLSNLLGYSVQSLFDGLRDTIVGAEGNNWDVMSWGSLATFVLAGGTAGAAGGIALFTSISTFSSLGALGLLLPSLLTGLLAVLVALAVMAARQALIIVLVILAPLAFVAFLLPNTEDLFTKWRKLFMTLLVLFPAFSLVFGGSQFASALIIQNATGDNGVGIIILAMLVQVAPLFVTPMLVRLSGSLIGRLAGMVNDRNKGMIDRTRNYMKDRAEERAARMRAERVPATGLRGAMRRRMQNHDHTRRRREGYKAAHTALSDGYFAQTQDGQDIAHLNHQAGFEKKEAEVRSNEHWADHLRTNPEMRARRIEQIRRQGNADLYTGEVESAGKEVFEQSVLQDDALRNIKAAQIRADTRAKIFSNITTNEGQLRANNEILADNSVGGIADLARQSAVLEGQVKLRQAQIDGRGKLAFREAVMANRALRLAEVETYELEQRAASSESIIKARAEAHWQYTRGTDATVRVQELEQLNTTYSAKKLEEQWNSFVQEVQTRGREAQGITDAEKAIADDIQNVQIDIEAETNRQATLKSDQQVKLAQAFEDNETIRLRAGAGTTAGATAVLAKAKQTIIRAWEETVAAEQSVVSKVESDDLFEMLDSGDISDEQMAAYAGVIAKRGFHADHVLILDKLSTMYKQAKEAGDEARMSAISDAQQQAMGDMAKIPFGMSDYDRKQASQGQYEGNLFDGERTRITSHISAESLASMDPDDMSMLFEMSEIDGALTPAQRQKIKDAYDDWKKDDNLKSRLQDKTRNMLDRIVDTSITGEHLGMPEPPRHYQLKERYNRKKNSFSKPVKNLRPKKSS